jgi:hypothetical protein
VRSRILEQAALAVLAALVTRAVMAIVDVAVDARADAAREAWVVALKKPTSDIGVGCWAIGPMNDGPRPKRTRPTQSKKKKPPSWC